MKVSEAIGKLKIGDTVWVKLKADGFDDIGAPLKVASPMGSDYMWLDENAEISTEPQAEKVEVPPMIDKFIKDHIDPIFEICAWSDHYGNDGRTCDDPELSVVLDWYGNNTTEFYEAVVNGYTVKSKRWVVKDSDDQYVYDLHLNHVISTAHSSYDTKLDVLTFTDKAKAEAVATLVDGAVEEVAE